MFRISFLAISSILLILVSCAKVSEHSLLDIYITWNDVDMEIGQEAQLAIRLYPDDATIGIPTVNPVWTSADTMVVSVDANGVIHAHGFGRTRVIVQWGGFKAEKVIVVNSEIKVDNEYLQQILVQKFDSNHDGKLYGIEVESVDGIDLSDLNYVTSPISFRGLEVFTRLSTLKISSVNIGYLDLSAFPLLKRVDLSQSIIQELDVHACPRLRWLDCHACSSLSKLYIGDFDTYGPCKLETIDCARCNISSLDLSRCEILEYLEYLENPIEGEVDLSPCPKLKVVNGQIYTRPDETETDSVAD